MVKDWGNRPICRIDVSAFLSIQIVLLITFWANAVFRVESRGVTVELFKARHSIFMPGADREDALIIAVMRDGKVYFDCELIRSRQLRDKLHDRWNSSTQKRLYIKADARAHYKAVAWVLNEARDAGIDKVSLLTELRRD